MGTHAKTKNNIHITGDESGPLKAMMLSNMDLTKIISHFGGLFVFLAVLALTVLSEPRGIVNKAALIVALAGSAVLSFVPWIRDLRNL